jgi:hypothetical protein
MDMAKLLDLANVLAGSDCSIIFGTEQAPFMGVECIVYVSEHRSEDEILHLPAAGADLAHRAADGT